MDDATARTQQNSDSRPLLSCPFPTTPTLILLGQTPPLAATFTPPSCANATQFLATPPWQWRRRARPKYSTATIVVTIDLPFTTFYILSQCLQTPELTHPKSCFKATSPHSMRKHEDLWVSMLQHGLAASDEKGSWQWCFLEFGTWEFESGFEGFCVPSTVMWGAVLVVRMIAE